MTRPPISRVVAGAASLLLLGVSTAAITPPTVKFSDTQLKNGVRVLISEDHVAPVVSVAIAYNVGSRDERMGRTGFAHLFEHMMFKGSQNVGPGEHFYSIFGNGGTMNGTTNKERTLYYETVPSNQLEMALFLEADRMRSLAIVRENLDNQREAVKEERRQGRDNQPYGRTMETLEEMAYENAAYEHSVIGSMDDLNAASVDDVASFFRTYYAPNNAVVAIVGDVNPATTLQRVRHHFESIPSQPAPPAVDIAEPLQQAERRTVVDDQLARLARVDVAYHVPPSPSPDNDAISVLGTVLAGGRSSRLYEALVRDKQVAASVTAFAPEMRGPRLFIVAGTAASGRPIDEVEAALHAEIERVKSGPIESWEIEKAQNAAKSRFVGSLGSSLSRAVALTQYTLLYGDPGLINTRYQRIAAVTAADVQRVARQYLTTANRTVVITKPQAPSQRSGGF